MQPASSLQTFSSSASIKHWLLSHQRLLTGLALAALVVAGFWTRLPLVGYNLPVAGYADERSGLQVLWQFNTVGLNPEYFHYPTFYYYVTYFFVAPWGFEHSLAYGRVLNLVIGCCLALATYWLARQLGAGRRVGLTAAGLTMFSPILIRSGGYVVTDALMATLTVLAFGFWVRFYQTRNYKDWLLGAIMIGLGISAKYTAVLAVSVYLGMEFFILRGTPPEGEGSDSSGLVKLLQRRFSPLILTAVCLAGGLALLMGAPLVERLLVAVAATQGDLNSTLDTSDTAFIHKILGLLVYSAWALLALALATFLLRRPLARWCVLRPFLALALIAVVFFIGSPYALISWPTLVYDFGAEVKGRALTGERTWPLYGEYLFKQESLVALLLAVPGAITLLRRNRSAYFLVGYLAFYGVILLTTSISVPRYLAPALPLVFILAGVGLWRFAEHIGRRFGATLPVAFLVLTVAIMAIELYPKIERRLEVASTTDEMHKSYDFVADLKPDHIYFAGYAPHVELDILGFSAEEVSQAELGRGSELLERMEPGDVLMVDSYHNNLLAGPLKAAVRLVFATEEGDGQYVYAMAE